MVDDAGHHTWCRHEMVFRIRKGPLPPRRSGRADGSDYRPRGACLHAVCAVSVGGDDRAVRRGRDRLCEAELIPAGHLAPRPDIEVEAHRSTGARAAQDDGLQRDDSRPRHPHGNELRLVRQVSLPSDPTGLRVKREHRGCRSPRSWDRLEPSFATVMGPPGLPVMGPPACRAPVWSRPAASDHVITDGVEVAGGVPGGSGARGSRGSAALAC